MHVSTRRKPPSSRAVTVVGVLLLLPMLLTAQDPVFSQFYNSPTYLNPAYTGMDGGISFTAVYKQQWFDIPGGFETQYLAYEGLESCSPLAIGLQLWRDVEGEGELETVAAALPIAGVLPLGSERRPINIRFAFAPYYMRKSINWDRLVFSDQLDPLEGNVLPTQFQANDGIPVSFGGVNMGALLRWDHPTKWKENMEFEVGFAVHNALNFRLDTGPIESLQGLTTGLPPRYVFHLGMYAPFFRIGSRLDIFRFVPQVRYESQGGLGVTSLGFLGHYQGASIGLFYQNFHPAAGFRNTDGLSCFLGFGFNVNRRQAVDLGLSYDLNVGGLRSNTGGSFEISLKYYIQSNGLLCGALNKLDAAGRGPGSNVRCPSVGRRHRKRWQGIWYRKGG